MAHCLWRAYLDHVEYLGSGVMRDEFQTYATLKGIGQLDIGIPTWGGVVPFVIWGLARCRDWCTLVQHDIWTPEHYLVDADPVQAKIINFSDFGEKGITLAPAIYCSLDSQHAFFAERVPEGNIVLAIQLIKEDSNG